MFADPQTVTLDSNPNTLPRVKVGDRTASYTNGDETLSLTISHSTTQRGRVRRVVRLDTSKVAADVFDANRSREVDAAAYLVVDELADSSYSNAELLTHVKGLLGWCTDANVTKVLSSES
jgi:hypothetical protein